MFPSVFGEQILVGLGQDPEVSRLCQTQIRAYLPQVFFYSQYDLYKRWLACMRITLMPMVVMLVGTVIHVILCYVFINVLHYDILSLACASSLNAFFLMVTVIIFGRLSSQIKLALAPFDREAFTGWWEYLKVSIPSTMMICAEWWAFLILSILSGILGVTSLASMSVCESVGALLWMVPLGIQEATCGIIGNCIGSNNVALAKRFFTMITIFTSVTISGLCLVILFARSQIIAFFTKDASVIELCDKVFIVIACMFIFDGM